VGVAREFLFILPLIYLFTHFFDAWGIWITFPVADVLAVTLSLVWVVTQARRQGIHFHLRYPKKAWAIDSIETTEHTTENR